MFPLFDYKLLRRWEEILELPPCRVERVRRENVENTYKKAYSFIGFGAKTQTFFYDRRVTEEDIVHELVHRKYPHWHQHFLVIKETRRLLSEYGSQRG